MKSEFPLPEAERIARGMAAALTPFCSRPPEIAGSIRRRKRIVGDIEIVCIPNPIRDMFDNPIPLETDHALNYLDWSLYGELKMNGNKQKKIILREGIQLDLFIVTPPAQFGVIFMIRTGSKEYSHKMVTHKADGGCLPGHLRVKDGAVWSRNHIIETPEEFNYFELCGVPYLEPWLRK